MTAVISTCMCYKDACRRRLMAAIVCEGGRAHCDVTSSKVILANGFLCRVTMLLSYGQRNDQLLARLQGNGDDANFNVLAVSCSYVSTH